MVLPYVVFGVSTLFLLLSTRIFVTLSEKISKSFRISPLIIGVTIVALGTSLPELSVSLVAILRHDPGLAFGNIIGSNIVNILLVFPVGILIGKLRVGTTKTQRNALLVLLVTGLFILMQLLHISPQVTGFLLLLSSIGVTLILYRWAQYGRDHEDLVHFKRTNVTKAKSIDYIFLLFSVVGITISGLVVVSSVQQISLLINLSTTILGLTLTAVVTSLPELLTTFFSQNERQDKITLGNIVGSNIYNLLFIGGLILFFSAQAQIPTIDWVWLIVITILFSVLLKIYNGKIIPRVVGIALLVVAAFYFYSLTIY